MSDELTILDQVETFGFPWHGLYRQATADVLLPNGATRPSSAGILTGDCYRVKHPDAPGAVTSAEETAQGMSWLDYALFAGSGRRYGGNELGIKRWVYIAPDGSVWLANLPIIGNAVGSGALSTTLTLSPFGRLGEPEDPAPTSQSIAVSISADWFTASHTSLYDDNRLYIDDINQIGSRALITPGVALGMLEIRISGVPPMATAELIVKWTAAEAKGAELSTTTIQSGPVGLYTKPVGSGTSTNKVDDVLLGGAYAQDGETVDRVVYSESVAATKTFDWTLRDEGYYIVDYHNTQHVDLYVDVRIGDRSVRWEMSADEIVYPEGGWNRGSLEISLPFNPYSLITVPVTLRDYFVTEQNQASGLSTIAVHMYQERLEFADFYLQTKRYGNGLWGFVVIDKSQTLWPNPPGLSLFRANSSLVGKLANGGVAVSEVNGGNVRLFASEHPVSGAIAHDVKAVCWI